MQTSLILNQAIAQTNKFKPLDLTTNSTNNITKNAENSTNKQSTSPSTTKARNIHFALRQKTN